MPFGADYYSTYQGWPERLVARYPELPFDDHCYLRIALDNTLGAKWDSKIRKPAYLHLSERKLSTVLSYFKTYFEDKGLLLEHHGRSLNFRNEWKRKQLKFAV